MFDETFLHKLNMTKVVLIDYANDNSGHRNFYWQ